MNAIFEISSTEELSSPCHKLYSMLKDHNVFVFNGEMGAGKTTLISKLCNLLDIQHVASPTFSIVNTYLSKQYGDVYHFDFYRLKDENEALDIGIEELLDSGNICFIEWAEKIHNLLPDKFVRVDIIVNNNSRKIIVSS